MSTRLIIFSALLHLVKIYGSFFPLIHPDRLYKYYPPENEVTFHLYHRSNPLQAYEIIIGDDTSLENSLFDPKLSTKIIIHGWTNGKETPWVKELSEVLATTGEWNVIVVDWAPLSHFIYVETRVHGYVVAKQVKKFIQFLERTKAYPLSSIHMIGHSMGAHIAARAGHDVQEENNYCKLGRITGLDPAAPLYEWPHMESYDEVLDPTDASFVDVIHTNGGLVGMIAPAGHVDYYPDGGMKQWGCYLLSCSHMRSCEFFIASVRKPDLFRAYSYDSWLKYMNNTSAFLEAYPMGIAASPEIPNGIYFLEVNDAYQPYVFSETSVKENFGGYFGQMLQHFIG